MSKTVSAWFPWPQSEYAGMRFVFVLDILLNRGKLIILSQDRHATDTKSTGEEGCLDTPDIENIRTRR